jgi:uncharacterized protein
MLRVIVDSNVLISRLLLPKSVSGRAVTRLVTSARLLVSEETLAELAQTLAREKFNPYVSLVDRQGFFELYSRLAEWVPIKTVVRDCRDAKDDKFLELAVDGRASLLVTGDKDLRALSPFRGVRVVTPAKVLAMTDAELALGPDLER